MKRRSRSQSDSVPLSNPRDGSTGMESPPLTPDDSSGHTKPSKLTTKKKKRAANEQAYGKHTTQRKRGAEQAEDMNSAAQTTHVVNELLAYIMFHNMHHVSQYAVGRSNGWNKTLPPPRVYHVWVKYGDVNMTSQGGCLPR